jgi:hypothetical protein
LHGRNDAKFGKARNVSRIDNLRVLVAPAWIGNLSLRRRHRIQSLLVLIENKAICPVANRMGFNLNAFLQGFFQHR